ncbi:hypothetical protein ABZ419_16950 [Streptomyces cinnamoneus]|uniref:hypothetical protein n=1 Tax=Streptomyces cinnamoneus TaxID=53446 RepID=UPI0033FC9C43
MTVFYCAKCSARLTPDLQELPAVPDALTRERDRDRKTRLAPSTVPRGSYAVDPQPWGAPFEASRGERQGEAGNRALFMPAEMTDLVSAGPMNSVIVHPDDVLSLQLIATSGIHWGCCGPLGTGGRNLACTCGVRIATLAADCMGPHELHLHPFLVYAYAADTWA